MFWTDAVLVLVICIVLCVLAYVKKVLTWDGSIAALIMGAIIGIAGGISWILLLLLFLVTSFAATLYKFAAKKNMGLQEGISGERGWRNVLANGAPPFIIALLASDYLHILDRQTGSILFLCAIAVAAADTLASELGVLAKKTWFITNLKRVKAGINGGISIPGQAAAAGAALYTGLVGVLVFHYVDGLDLNWLYVVLIADIGFLGCQLDSLIGATIENKGYVSKLTNNLTSITVGAMLAWLVMIWLL
jgi:uncharacterized protein (TIGR00297 family)